MLEYRGEFFYVDLISPCSVSCSEVVFSIRALTSLCGEAMIYFGDKRETFMQKRQHAVNLNSLCALTIYVNCTEFIDKTHTVLHDGNTENLSSADGQAVLSSALYISSII